MKAIAIAAFAAVIVLAAAQGTVYMSQYDDFLCKGAPSKNFTLPTGTCEAGGGGHQDITGVIFNCPQANASALCAQFDLYFHSDNCSSQRDITENVQCGVCLWEPFQGYYKYSCDQVAKTVTGHHQCDKSCMNCNVTAQLAVGQCKQIGVRNNTHFEQSAKLLQIQQCPPFIGEQVWYNGTKCTGGSTHNFNLEQGVCYEGTTFSCTAPKSATAGRTGRLVDARREKVLGKLALNRFLRHQNKK